jgi:hypothetical protein
VKKPSKSHKKKGGFFGPFSAEIALSRGKKDAPDPFSIFGQFL